jgi:hypothetical protein
VKSERRRIMANRILLLGITLGVSLFVVTTEAHTAQCTRDDGIAAESATDHIESWKNMYRAFRQFRQCDDGGVAEGFSEADAKLMADHWSRFRDLLHLVRKDSAFERFVIDHLDETDDNRDLVKIDRLALTACPIAANDFCAEIHAHLKSLECNPSFPEGVGCPSSTNR